MMKSASNYKDRFHILANRISLFFYITCIAIATIFSLHLISNHNKIKYTNDFNQTSTFTQPNKECDLFKGQWIRDEAGPLYTNYSCKTIPTSKNCFLHGRKDRDFLHWRWKPHKCELPRFSAQTFLSILRGKKMAFIGDSLARNQMESLLCLLSTAETPKSIERDADNKFTTWEFPEHNFTLAVYWSQFLVAATELTVNGTATGSFDLHLDKPDPRWTDELPSIDYAVFSGGHWFVRENYLYEDGRLVGCVFCHRPDVTHIGPGQAIGRAFRAALRAVNGCGGGKRIASFVRTYSPPHFEHGEWNTGGRCNRTRPVGPDEVDGARSEWEYRRVQVEEAEAAGSSGGGNVVEVMDVTEMMATRFDGHPDRHWQNRWKNDYRDCAHWCMPGPIDTWNQLLLEMVIVSSRK